MLHRGDTFGSYRIVARLKAGGMAQLYLARREGAAGFKRPVALKVIHPHLAKQPEFVKMFVDEATLSAKVHDPNVVHVEDLGQSSGGPFLAMEYVHGTALANVLRAARVQGRRLKQTFLAHVVAQVASGLHAAHETTDESGRPLGIVHRDVSPQNVLIAFKGHIKVIDFGVAKAVDQELTGKRLHGKIAYMPPEQARSEAIDRRADVYALGIVLWEMLVGRRLFEADNDIVLLERVRNPRIERPSQLVADVIPALDDLVMAMLEVDPAKRPASALEVKRRVLDAVPEARNVDASDVAALLRALLPEEIAQQDKMLAAYDAQQSATEGVVEEDETTKRIVEPADAFVQFTMPAVMVRDLAVSPPPLSTSTRSAANRVTLLFGLVALVVLGIVALVVRGSAKAPAADAPVATFPPPPPLPTEEPAPLESESAAVTPAPEPSSPTSSSSSASKPPRVASPPPPLRPAKKPAAPTPPPPSVPKGPNCRVVDGVQLCTPE